MTELEPERKGRVISGGRQIYWEYFGQGDREAVCLLNGLAMSTKSWFFFLPMLLPEWDVILFDYPGQGDSCAEDVPCTIPGICDSLTRIADELQIERFHLMGISYGGFVAVDYARLYPRRLHTLTLSGTLLTHEELFRMYQELSLRFYRSGSFELYTHYMYEKIFGESFVRKIGPQLEVMRGKFNDRFRDRVHSLVRLTEAQDPFFENLERNLPAYGAIPTPTLIMAGAEDRAIPNWVQRKICRIIPNVRFETVSDCGHVVYLEQSEHFFGNLKKFMSAKSLDF